MAKHQSRGSIFWQGWLPLGVLGAVLLWMILQGAGALNYTWQWERVPETLLIIDDEGVYPGNLLFGLGETLKISTLSIVLALPVGVLLAGAQRSVFYSLRVPAYGFFSVVRNTPLLVQLYVFYFIFGPVMGLDRLWVAVGGLVAFQGAYLAPIILSGFDAIPKGQAEAAAALGLGRVDVFLKLLFPQAIRILLPALTNEAVNLIKNSALLSAVSIFEVVTEGKDIIADTFMSFEIWLTIGALYLCINIPLSVAAQLLETKWRTA